ncbi:hypothetical protein HJG60_009739 [Phyllostomus discolor]|uniref:Uncharacterized protein n=1 Tax=Phyllostomus discolor TaxID=89673 RepID=A0A834B9D8_9CHIR|nr:hypothetical protein HJG60_009739 [Phyllostomus discolor]
MMSPSPRVSGCRSGRQRGGQGSHQHLTWKHLGSQVVRRADEVLGPAGQSLRQLMPREIGMVWSSTLGCGVQLSRQWFATYLRHTIESAVLHPPESLDKCLGSPDGKWRLSPGAHLWVVPLCRHGCPDHVCRYLRCVSLPDVSGVT